MGGCKSQFADGWVFQYLRTEGCKITNLGVILIRLLSVHRVRGSGSRVVDPPITVTAMRDASSCDHQAKSRFLGLILL